MVWVFGLEASLKVKDHTQQPQGLGHAGSVPAIPRRSACHTGSEVLGGKSINGVVGIRDNRCTLHRASPCESDDNPARSTSHHDCRYAE
jgi:hypothetical protein